LLVDCLNHFFREVLSKVSLNFRNLPRLHHLFLLLNRFLFLFCLKVFLHIGCSFLTYHHHFALTHIIFFILYHFSEATLRIILCDFFDFLVDLDCHWVLLVVVRLVKHVVPGEGVVEPDIEHLVPFFEFVSLTLIALGEQVLDREGEPGI
jgi:hypothetical protein